MSFGQGILTIMRIPGKLAWRGLLLVLALLATGCATMNVSSFENAVPNREEDIDNKKIFISTGIELAGLFFPEEGWPRSGWDREGYYLSPISGIQLSPRGSEKVNASLQFWTSLGSIGGKIQANCKLAKLGCNYLALIPGMTFGSGFAEERKDFDESTLEYNYFIGADLQLLYTLKFSRDWSFTLIGRGAGTGFYQTFRPEYAWYGDDDFPTGERGVWHYGWRANLRFPVGRFHLIPEAGAEYLSLRHGRIMIEPVVGLAFQF